MDGTTAGVAQQGPGAKPCSALHCCMALSESQATLGLYDHICIRVGEAQHLFDARFWDLAGPLQMGPALRHCVVFGRGGRESDCHILLFFCFSFHLQEWCRGSNLSWG